jgi:hypothetical protein
VGSSSFHLQRAATIAVLGLVSACSGPATAPRHEPAKKSSAPKEDAPVSKDAAAPESFEIGAPPGGEWSTLMTLDWSLSPGSENFWCKRVTATKDFWIRGYRQIAPVGTHHVTLSKEPGDDGVSLCDIMPEHDFLFASGLSLGDVVLPDGTGARVTAGDQLYMTVHAFNTSTEPIAAASGLAILGDDGEAPLKEVSFTFAGSTFGLVVAPGHTTQHGQCAIRKDTSLLALWPHMHRLGVHERISVRHGTEVTTLLDRPYSFGEQTLYWQTQPLPLAEGDAVLVDCTYDNPGAQNIYFGQSTTDEMCFAGLYTTPAFIDTNICTD